MSKLIILRGNSGSGKSTVALAIAKNSKRKVAVIDADFYRVQMLFPQGENKQDMAALMIHNVQYCLDHGYTVIWDSIFVANDRNKKMFSDFFKQVQPKENYIFNFDVSFEETVNRHGTRKKSNDFGPEHMKEWYRPVEKLGYDFEYLIPESNTLKDTINLICQTAKIEMNEKRF